MSFLATLNRTLFKRSSTFFLVVAGGAFFFERSFELLSVSIFNSINKGKSYEDLQRKLAAVAEE